MPPKKPDDLKNRKKPDEKAAEGKKEPQKEPEKQSKEEPNKDEIPKKTPWEKTKWYLVKPYIQMIPVLVFLLLFLLAVLYFNLYKRELKKLEEKYRAVTRIRQFMAQYNDSFQEQSELESMKGVELVLYQLEKLRHRNTEVVKSTDEVIEKIKKNWIPYKGHLYFFDNRVENFETAKKDCRDHKAWLVYIKSPQEESFLEREINRRNDAFWIGLIKQFLWDWVSGDRLSHQFWDDESPTLLSSSRKVCAYIRKCTTPGACWRDEYCDQKKKWICKWKGDARWL